ncbi:hypothetical protein M674_14095, partial [Neisseria gonorrhoeae SK708]
KDPKAPQTPKDPKAPQTPKDPKAPTGDQGKSIFNLDADTQAEFNKVMNAINKVNGNSAAVTKKLNKNVKDPKAKKVLDEIDIVAYYRTKIENMLVGLRNQLGDCNYLRHTLPQLKATLTDLEAHYKALQTAWTAYYDAREANRYVDQSRDQEEQDITVDMYAASDISKSLVEAEQDKTQVLIDETTAQVKEAEGKLAACKAAVDKFIGGVHDGINKLTGAKDAKAPAKAAKAQAAASKKAAAAPLAKTGAAVALAAVAASV